jgi:hypothetical protein
MSTMSDEVMQFIPVDRMSPAGNGSLAAVRQMSPTNRSRSSTLSSFVLQDVIAVSAEY